jgi:hypothetical protein
MKKFLVICAILVLLLCGLGAATWTLAPTIGLRLLSKAIGGTVQVSGMERGYKEGHLVFTLDDVVMKGSVEGTIKKWHLRINPWKGFRIAYVGVTDFEISVKDSQQGKVDLVPIPVELVELRGGILKYKGQTYRVRHLTVRNLNSEGQIEFDLDGGIEGLGDFKSKGKGFLKEKRSEIEGELSYSRLDMSKVLKDYEGFLGGSGSFTLREMKLSCIISVEASDFVMREKFLREPLRVTHALARAEVAVLLEELKVDVHLDNLFFKEVPVDLKFAVTGKDLSRLELRTGFLAVSDVKKYIDLTPFADRGSEILALLKDGSILVKKLTFTYPKPFLAEFDLADVSVATGDIEVREISGVVNLTDDALLVSNAKGALQRSTLHDVSGRVPFSADKEITGKGKFTVDLRDLSAFLEPDGIRFTGGMTDGEVEVRCLENAALAITGAGMVSEAEIVWGEVALKASGRYHFSDKEAILEPLVVSKGDSQVALNGSLQKDAVRLSVNGTIGASELSSLLKLPYSIDGVVAATGDVVKEKETLSARGELSLKEFSLDIPGVVNKPKGIESTVAGAVRWDGARVSFETLTCRLADAVLQASGQVSRDKVSDLKADLHTPHLETLSKYLFSGLVHASGNARLGVSAREVRFPIREIPEVTGAVELHEGIVQLPFFVKPLTEIELVADLKPGISTVNLTKLRIGSSVLRAATASLDRTGSPNFSLMIDMENLEPADLTGPKEREFRIPVIGKESLLARLSGELKIRAQRMAHHDLVANSLELSGAFTDRALAVQKLTGQVLDGAFSFEGRADLSGDMPAFQVSGEARNIKGGLLIRLFDPESNVLVASGRMSGNLSSAGSDSEELVRNLEGSMAVVSRNGVIRKWNLLSKVLGLLNVYESFRGKIDLGQEGMPYTVTALTLRGEKGVFSTDDFLLNSPSMVIVGQGSVDLPQGMLDGTLVVSPLVALNRTIDYIPILRSIFKRREGGFVYVAYDVKGPMRDPQLSTSYVQTVGKRLLDILKNIVLLPIEVFQK